MIGATNSVLHAYRAVTKPILSLLAGAAVKLTVAYFLIGSPAVGLPGAPISTFLCNATVVGMNLSFAARLCRVEVEKLGGTFAKPLIASVLSVGLCGVCYRLLVRAAGESALLTLGALIGCLVLYPVFGCLCGGIGREDIMLLPGGEKLCRALTFCRLLPRREEEKKEKNEEHERTGKGTVGEKTV